MPTIQRFRGERPRRLAASRHRAAGVILIMAGLAQAAGGDAAPDTWPLFRGTAALTGRSAADFSVRPVLAWTHDLGAPVHHGAILDETRVWIATTTGGLTALDRASGIVRWTYQAETGFSAPPARIANRVFIGDEAGRLHALDAATGAPLWQFETGGKLTASAVPGPKGTLLVGSYDHRLHALDVADGAVRWTVETDAPIHAAVCIRGGWAVIAGCDGMIRILDAVTGEPRHVIEGHGSFAAHAAAIGDILYTGSMQARYLSIHLPTAETVPLPFEPVGPCQAGPALSAEEIVWGARDGTVYCFDRPGYRLRWQFHTGGAIEGAPVLSGEALLVPDMQGQLIALDRRTGTKRWRFDTGAPLRAAPAAGRGILVVASEDGIVYALKSVTE